MSAIMEHKYEAPCHDCEDRYIGCHGECEKYLEYREKEREWRRKIYREQMARKNERYWR